ncbi:hypothetical protein BDR05DRAFT_975794 [Suillus weaverae]|nr:hypothetical protein BDR05DRAFT_975794 [Suillus weaverae]
MGWTDEDLEELHRMAQLEDAQDAMSFITALCKASLDDPHSHLPEEALARLRNPPHQLPGSTDLDLILSLKYYFANLTVNAYNLNMTYSHYHIKNAVTELSGMVPIVHDMCPNTCLAFTGPYADLACCPRCREGRWDPKKTMATQKVAHQTFNTFLIGLQLQALWRHPDNAEKIILDELKMTGGIPDVYEDILHGKQYLDACQSGKIKDRDAVLMLLIDGTQLYESKCSDCWIYILVLFGHSPDVCYQKKYVLPGSIIPGPKKPKNLDLFVVPGLQHLHAIQAEGLAIWDGAQQKEFHSNPFLFVATVDGPGMVFLTGLVGHHGKMGCHLYCGLQGHHKPGAPTYYPALHRPHDGHDHPDVLIHQIPHPGSFDYDHNLEHVICCMTNAEYELVCLETGISKPSIFCGFDSNHILLILLCFSSDIMHIAAINTGSFRAEPTDDKSTWAWAVLKKEIWKAHGALIADTTLYLPGSFDRPPCNPAEKISSGYKAWEWLLYLYGMAPATLSHGHLLDFADEFKEIYYQSHMDHLHFVRPWVHSITHIAPETVNKGPLICSSQWTMEQTISNLTQEIHLQNVSVNTIKAIIPSIEPAQSKHPKGSQPLENGYVLLGCREQTAHPVCQCEADAILQYLSKCGIHIATVPSVTCLARLHLPNGQVACSAWKENGMSRQPRMAHNVKSSFQMVFACCYQGDISLKLVEVSVIHSVVAMVLHKFPGIDGTLFYMIEHPGLDVLKMRGMNKDLHDED